MKDSVIIISGIPGSGNTTIAKLLAEKLSLDYFSMGQLFKDIASGRYKEKNYFDKLLSLCEERKLTIPSFSSSNDSEGALNLWETDFGRSREFHEVIDELQRNLAERGKIVIDGKLSLFIVKNADFKIWLKSESENRVARTSTRDSLEKDKTLEIINKRHEKERAEWKKIYGLDYLEQEKLADIVIDTTHSSPKEIVEKIISFLNQKIDAPPWL